MSIKSKFFLKCAENAFFKFADFETAMKMIDRAIASDNKDTMAHVFKSSILIRSGYIIEALKALVYAVQVNPESAEEYTEIKNLTVQLLEDIKRQY